MKIIIKKSISNLKVIRLRIKWDAKLRNILKANKSLTNSHIDNKEKVQIKKYFSKYKLKPNMKAYTIYNNFQTKNQLFHYISDDIFHIKIEEHLNRNELAAAYSDKNFLDRLFPEIFLPETLLRNINGCLYSKNYKKINYKTVEKLIEDYSEDLILKPSIGTAAGSGVKLFELSKIDNFAEREELLDFIKSDNSDYIVQKKIIQHSTTSHFYKKSVNTFRVITCVIGDKIIPLSTVFRMGSKSYIDNFSAGGVCCGISRDGFMSEFAVDKFYNKYQLHPTSSILFKDKYFDYYQDIVEFAIRMHGYVPNYFKLISWDIAKDSHGELVLIEMNLLTQQIDFHQIHNGPLFGEYTEFILKEISNPSSYMNK